VIDTRHRGILIAAEGLDGSGKTAGLDALGRWLERKGRRVHVATWEPSRLVARIAATPRGRQVLTPRVAALLAAAESTRRLDREVRPRLARGDVVLCDRYAWTGAAREIARGLEPAWVVAIHRFAPPPDLVIYHRQDPAVALARALASRPERIQAQAVAGAFEDFLGRLFGAYDALLAGASGSFGPWPVRVVELEPSADTNVRIAAVRDAVRPLLSEAATVA
jgi:dTMP kinase